MTPQRIACLSSETAEIVYALGAGDRVVARSAFCVRPEAVKSQPVVSSFTGVRLDRLRSFEPDLVLTFSDLQKDICQELVGAGFTVFSLNQRTLAGVFQAVRWLGALLGLSERAEIVVNEMQAEIDAIQATTAGWTRRPKVYFEEWDDPLISGIGWVGEVIALAGGEDLFPELSHFEKAPERVVTSEEVIRRAPDVMLASWCGKPFKPDAVRSREGWAEVPAVRDGELHGLPGEEILSAGPALVDGLKRVHGILADWHRRQAEDASDEPFERYFWGYAFGRGMSIDDGVRVVTTDAAVGDFFLAGWEAQLSEARRTRPRFNIHRPHLAPRGEVEERELTLHGDDLPAPESLDGVVSAVGEESADFWRGVTDACGILCFRKRKRRMGLAFSHADEQRMADLRALLARRGWQVSELQLSKAGNHWFDIHDDDVPRFGDFIYEGAGELFSPQRRARYDKALAQLAAAAPA